MGKYAPDLIISLVMLVVGVVVRYVWPLVIPPWGMGLSLRDRMDWLDAKFHERDVAVRELEKELVEVKIKLESLQESAETQRPFRKFRIPGE